MFPNEFQKNNPFTPFIPSTHFNHFLVISTRNRNFLEKAHEIGNKLK